MSDFKPIIEQSEAKDYWWCSCGRSKNQPFCDGSHEGTGYSPQKMVILHKNFIKP